MEKIERDRSKWSYTKAAAYSGTLGLIVAIVYTVFNFIRFGVTEPFGGFIGGTIGQFFFNHSWLCNCWCYTFYNL